MRIVSPDTAEALSAPVVPMAQLVLMQFPGLTIALNSSNIDIDWDGITYKGAFGLGGVSLIEDSPGEIKGIQLSLSGASSEMVALALDDAGIVQGTPVVIRTAILDPETYALLDAPLDFRGRLDTMPLQEDGEESSIAATAESVAVDLLSSAALTYSNADQQYLYPGDRAFEYVTSQPDMPVVWPTKQWFIATGGR